jgi:hypothetical protein
VSVSARISISSSNQHPLISNTLGPTARSRANSTGRSPKCA